MSYAKHGPERFISKLFPLKYKIVVKCASQVIIIF